MLSVEREYIPPHLLPPPDEDEVAWVTALAARLAVQRPRWYNTSTLPNGVPGSLMWDFLAFAPPTRTP